METQTIIKKIKKEREETKETEKPIKSRVIYEPPPPKQKKAIRNWNNKDD